jgi:hypothetical protein
MAGGKGGRHAIRLAKFGAVLLVDNDDRPTERCAQLRGPFLAAAAARIAVHGDVRRDRGRGREHDQQCGHPIAQRSDHACSPQLPSLIRVNSMKLVGLAP